MSSADTRNASAVTSAATQAVGKVANSAVLGSSNNNINHNGAPAQGSAPSTAPSSGLHSNAMLFRAPVGGGSQTNHGRGGRGGRGAAHPSQGRGGGRGMGVERRGGHAPPSGSRHGPTTSNAVGASAAVSATPLPSSPNSGETNLPQYANSSAAGGGKGGPSVRGASCSSSDSDNQHVQATPVHRRRSILHIRGGGGCGLHNFAGGGRGTGRGGMAHGDRNHFSDGAHRERAPRRPSVANDKDKDKGVGRKRSRSWEHSRQRRGGSGIGRGRGNSASKSQSRESVDHDHLEGMHTRRAISRQRSPTPVRGSSAAGLSSRGLLPSPVPIQRLDDAVTAGNAPSAGAAPQPPSSHTDSYSPEPRSPSSRHRGNKSPFRAYSDELECELRYPRFDGGLPRRRGAIPFLSLLRSDGKHHAGEGAISASPRQRLTPLLPPSSRRRAMVVAAPVDGDLPSLPLLPPNTQLVAYGEYIVHKVLGKGVGSIVVQVSRIDESCDAGEDGVVSDTTGAGGDCEMSGRNLRVTSSGQQRITIADSTPQMFGLKLFRGWSTYDKACDEEAALLASVMRRTNTRYLLPAVERIEHPSHCALLFPLCGPSVLDVLEGNRTNGLSKGLPHSVVKSVLYQLLSCVRDLHAAGVVHTDIKPENVLFRSTETFMTTFDVIPSQGKNYIKREVPDPTGALLPNGQPRMVVIKERLKEGQQATAVPIQKTMRIPVTSAVSMIDLGNAVYMKDLILKDEWLGARPAVSRTFIQTRHYRAPEVVFDAGWDHSSDLWSVGCMVTELITGDCLFPMHNDAEHVALMERALGPIPAQLYGRTKVAREFCSQYQLTTGAHGSTSPTPEGVVPNPVTVPGVPSATGAALTGAAPMGGLISPPVPCALGHSSPPLYLRLRSSYAKQLSKSAVRSLERQRTLRRLIEKNVAGEEGRRLADLTEGLLQYDPMRRLSAQEACDHPYFTQLW